MPAEKPSVPLEPEVRVETEPEPAAQVDGETAPDAGAKDDETTLGGGETPAEDTTEDEAVVAEAPAAAQEAPEITIASEDVEPGPAPEASDDEVALSEEEPVAETQSDAPDLADDTTAAPAEEEAPETTAALADIEPEPERAPGVASPEGAAPDETVSTPPVEEQEPNTFVVTRAATESGEGASQSGSIEHTVRENELLSEIASLYGVSAADLVRWNDLRQAKLEAGSTLTIKLEPEGPIEEEFDFKVPSEDQEDETIPDLSALTGKILHTVAPDDTLPELAKRYKVSVEDLTLWNGLDDGAIEEGQKLTIFLDSEQQPADGADEVKTVEYEVQEGDTLLKIAREFATTRDVLLEINEIKDANHIFVGQKLKVPAGT